MLEQKQELGRVCPWSWKQAKNTPNCVREEKVMEIPRSAGTVEKM